MPANLFHTLCLMGANTNELVDFKLYKNKRFTEEHLQHFILDEN